MARVQVATTLPASAAVVRQVLADTPPPRRWDHRAQVDPIDGLASRLTESVAARGPRAAVIRLALLRRQQRLRTLSAAAAARGGSPTPS